MRIENLVLDVNGTLAVDGTLLPGVAEALINLTPLVTIHLLTADTHGRQVEIDRILGTKAIILKPGGEPDQKASYVKKLGAESVIAIGQGANDEKMILTAGLGIAVLSLEGTYPPTLHSADVIAPDILTALNLLLHPKRLAATLRR